MCLLVFMTLVIAMLLPRMQEPAYTMYLVLQRIRGPKPPTGLDVRVTVTEVTEIDGVKETFDSDGFEFRDGEINEFEDVHGLLLSSRYTKKKGAEAPR